MGHRPCPPTPKEEKFPTKGSQLLTLAAGIYILGVKIQMKKSFLYRGRPFLSTVLCSLYCEQGMWHRNTHFLTVVSVMLRLCAQLLLTSLMGAYASFCLLPPLYNWVLTEVHPRPHPQGEVLTAPWLPGIGPVTQTPEAPHWASVASFLSQRLRSWVIDVPGGNGHTKITFSLYVDQLWMSVTATICFTRKLLWWGWELYLSMSRRVSS